MSKSHSLVLYYTFIVYFWFGWFLLFIVNGRVTDIVINKMYSNNLQIYIDFTENKK